MLIFIIVSLYYVKTKFVSIIIVFLGEALGAIGTPEVFKILQRFTNDSAVEVAETCQLALERVKWLESKEKIEALTTNPYSSIDPAPPATETNIENLKNILLDEKKTLFERYRVMFSLRNMNNVESALALTEGENIVIIFNSLLVYI